MITIHHLGVSQSDPTKEGPPIDTAGAHWNNLATEEQVIQGTPSEATPLTAEVRVW